MPSTDNFQNPASVASTKPKRVFFPTDTEATAENADSVAATSSIPASSTPADAPAPVVPRATRTRRQAPPATPVTPAIETGAVGKKRGPKPSAEPLERSTLKLRQAVLHSLDSMLEDAPRHVKKQDLVDYIFTDFFKRHPTLPAELKKKPAKA